MRQEQKSKLIAGHDGFVKCWGCPMLGYRKFSWDGLQPQARARAERERQAKDHSRMNELKEMSLSWGEVQAKAQDRGQRQGMIAT